MFWKLRQKWQVQQQAANQLIQAAQAQTKAMLVSAAQKAEQIIRETHFFSRQVHDDLKRSMASSADRLSQQNQEHISEIVKVYERELQTIAKKVEARAIAEVEKFGAATAKNIAELQQQLAAAARQQQQTLQHNVEQEQEKKLAQVAARLKQILPDLVKELVGEVIPLKEHEKLVLDRLSEIKQAGLWK